MDKKIELLEHSSNNVKVYEIKVGNINVEINYANNGKKIDECMLNVIKQKAK